jgi:hypothetical protein
LVVGETMNILPVVLTSPRPQSTLLRTLGSLKRAGWPLVRVFDGTPAQGNTCPIGCTVGNVALMESVISEGLCCDALLIVEDDVVFCRGVREYLESMTWPSDPEKIVLCSPYCNEAYSGHDKPYGANGRWHREIRGLYLAGSQAWMYPLRILPRVIEAIKTSEFGVDRAVGAFAGNNLEVWYHTPSLAQHIGVGGNSAVGYVDCGTIYHSSTFVGENFDARTLA